MERFSYRLDDLLTRLRGATVVLLQKRGMTNNGYFVMGHNEGDRLIHLFSDPKKDRGGRGIEIHLFTSLYPPGTPRIVD